MKMMTNSAIDRLAWGRGPWSDEPDKAQWQDEATGFVCLAVRVPESGHWCGYVGIPEGHPLFGVDYDTAHERYEIYVHGGLTFADKCQNDKRRGEFGVCHIPEPGQPDHVWWLGFDCAHCGDTSPGLSRFGTMRGDTYRTLDYVREECRQLAETFHRIGQGDAVTA
jgi:hypothetical protein